MVNSGYCKKLASGSVCAGGGLGVIIPPSILLILYGPVAGVSISKLFAAAVIPGLILSISYMTYVFIRCTINPSLAPVVPPEERNNNLRETTDFIIKTLFPFLALILLVLGSIFFGIAAPTEAAAVGAIGGIVLTIAYKRMTLQIFKESVQQTVKITSMVMFVVLGANLFTGVFLRLGGGRLINDAILYLSLGRIGTLVVMLLGIFVLGMFMDWVGLLMILVPIYAPISGVMNYDPIWFGILFCITLQISYMTPPFAYSAFYLKGVAPPGVSLKDIYKGGIPFVIIQLLAMILFIIYPELSTWLPSNM